MRRTAAIVMAGWGGGDVYGDSWHSDEGSAMAVLAAIGAAIRATMTAIVTTRAECT